MKAFIFLILFCGIAGAKEFDFTFDPLSTTRRTSKQSKTVKFGNLEIKENADGLGVHSDQYGRPVKYQVIGQPKANTDLLKGNPLLYKHQG